MKKGELLYEGKAKQVYATDDPDYVIQYFKDDATAFNAKKRGTIVSKGILNNQMSEIFFRLLERDGVPTHFVERLSEREMLVKRLPDHPGGNRRAQHHRRQPGEAPGPRGRRDAAGADPGVLSRRDDAARRPDDQCLGTSAARHGHQEELPRVERSWR